MNSDEEKLLFEAYGWQYDYVGRKWVAPDGYEVETDTLVTLADLAGRQIEAEVRTVARKHGRRS